MQHTGLPPGPPSASLPQSKDASLANLTSNSLRRRATERSSTVQQRCGGEHRRQHSVSPTMMSTEEFDALPECIQKKYFSPVERLRINQQSLAKKRSKQSLKGAWLSSSSQLDVATRPSTSPGLQRPKSRAKKPDAVFTSQLTLKHTDVSEEQARWFLALPEKIRRQQFTREEQVTLMVRCKKVVEALPCPGLAQDAYRRCGPTVQPPSRMSTTSKHRLSTSIATSVDECRSFLDLETASVHTTETSNAEMKIFNMYSHHNESNESKDENIETVQPVPSIDDLEIPAPPQRLPFRRLSLARVRLPPPTLAPPIPPLPPLAPLSPIRSNSLSSRPVSFANRLSRPYKDFLSSRSDLSLETATESRSYHDEDARKQLRQTLLSPEKFEEALEFGFAKEEPLPTTLTPTDTFKILALESEDADSLFGEDEADYTCDDDDTSVEPVSPRTPTPVSDPLSTGIKFPSFDSGSSVPIFGSTRLKTPPLTHISRASSIATRETTSREMTIHLTLTRRDLRSPEDELYSVQRQQTSGVAVEKVDPLALESLPVCDDATGAHGAFAVQGDGKGLKKVWKSLLKH